MKIAVEDKIKIIIALSLFVLMAACSENDDTIGGSEDTYLVKIIVLKNNTNVRVDDASITIDNDEDLSCQTPGGDTGGSCTFMLMKGWHTVHVFKVGYRAVDSTLLVSNDMTKAYSLFNF